MDGWRRRIEELRIVHTKSCLELIPIPAWLVQGQRY